MTIGRQNLIAIISEINGELTSYLNCFNYQALSQQQLSAGYMARVYDNDRQGFINQQSFYIHSSQCHNQKYIAMVASPGGRPALTMERIKNIYEIHCKLTAKITSLKETKEDAIQANDEIKGIQKLLDEGREHNIELSLQHGAVHRSYQDNRLAKHGIFSSWLKKTWTQSRADRVLQNSLDNLDRFQKRAHLESPPSYASQGFVAK